MASTAALASGSDSQDGRFTATDAALSTLGGKRDRAATTIKNDLDRIEFHGGNVDHRVLGAELVVLPRPAGRRRRAGGGALAASR